ncbi:hypothetical protein [Streptomyces sp. NPDC049040]|uniref:hypothetical protein n=1 Tax=Streptomyces sp. NPDC049040 TaxID=3365593 RepID=UPI0037166876
MTLLPDLPQNAALLEQLRAQGVPQRHGDYAYEGWELHAHPELAERLADLAPHCPILAVYGLPVLAADGIAAVVARGTSALLVRLPEAPPEILERAAPYPPLTDPGRGWYTVSPWQRELGLAASKRLLSQLVRRALTHAARLAQNGGTDRQGPP